MNNQQAVILSACRTPIGTFLGDLAPLTATRLGAIVVGNVVRRAGVALTQVDEVILGNVLSAGLGQAPARQAALGAGLPPTVAAVTINKMCGSGLKAVMLAAQAVQLGDAEIVVAGGMESMSRAPHLLSGARSGWKFGDQKVTDSMLNDGLVCAFDHCHMGNQAEHIARVKQISRADQDEFAAESQRRAVAAIRSGAFKTEIVPVEKVAVDQGPRADTSLEKLAQLKPVFERDGTVTAGNSSQLSDGAAAVVVASNRFADKHGLKPLARIVAYATAGVEPCDVFIAPVFAVQALLKKCGLAVADIDLWELNEAFAAQMVACERALNLPRERLNVHGGAIALGHPIGASGARVLVTLLHAMQQRGAQRGLAALCLGGGNAVAMIVERTP
jgi:acetyl-CoA C-acetyltransferase